jgi:hypothetical protein
MVRTRLISREEAQNTRKSKTPGLRRQRMTQFDEYAQMAIANPDAAVVYEELGENPQKFVLSLRGAFKRAGVHASVRKMRGRDEVRVWLIEPPAPAPTPAPARRRTRA